MIGLGTLINVGAIIIGGLLGLFLGGVLSDLFGPLSLFLFFAPFLFRQA